VAVNVSVIHKTKWSLRIVFFSPSRVTLYLLHLGRVLTIRYPVPPLRLTRNKKCGTQNCVPQTETWVWICTGLWVARAALPNGIIHSAFAIKGERKVRLESGALWVAGSLESRGGSCEGETATCSSCLRDVTNSYHSHSDERGGGTTCPNRLLSTTHGSIRVSSSSYWHAHFLDKSDRIFIKMKLHHLKKWRILRNVINPLPPCNAVREQKKIC